MKLLDRLIRRAPRAAAAPAMSIPSTGVADSDESRFVAAGGESIAQEYCRRGDALLEQGRAEEALQAYRQAIDQADACSEGHLGEARAYCMLERDADAADCLEIALALDPDSIDALQLLARIRRELGENHAAIELMERALALAAQSAELNFDLALSRNRVGDTRGAMECYRKAMEIAPADPAPRINLGLIHLQQLGEPREAEMLFRSALALAPMHVEAAANLGLALHDQGRFDEAFEVYRAGLAAHQDDAAFRWNQALARLSLGEFALGWNDYELRFARPGARRLERFDYPRWEGQHLHQGRLLVLAEQGVGDEIMFASCIPDLAATANGVVMECAPRLEGLFRRSFPSARVHGLDRHAPADWLCAYPDIAAKIPIGSLPRLLRRSDAEFPVQAGYLVADTGQTALYRERLRSLDGALTVGVSWRAGTRATRGELRSIGFERLRPLFTTPQVRFVSLQHGMTAEERVEAHAAGVMVWDEALADLDAQAALISALDLVVTVANTSAHLSGALGRPTWVLLNEAPEWRWLRKGERSPWYPSAVLMRAAHRPPWGELVQMVQARLEARTRGMAIGNGGQGEER